MTTTLTITDLLRACDEPDVDRYLVLSQLADAYADAGDTLRSDAARWLAERGKWPEYSTVNSHRRALSEWNWWNLSGLSEECRLTQRWWWSKSLTGATVASAIGNAIDAYAELGGRIE